MTPKPNESVLDVNVDVYLLNGKVLGKTQDVFLSDDILIEPLNDEFEKMRDNNEKFRIRFSEDVYYSVFYKILMTAAFWGRRMQADVSGVATQTISMHSRTLTLYLRQ